MLWRKQPVSDNALIAVTLKENTEWFGWTRDPSHVHYLLTISRLPCRPRPMRIADTGWW